MWTDGRIYEGEWKNNSMSGKMRLSYEDGRFFQGFYKDDEKSGSGVYSWPDGRMFFGNWIKGVINGEGVEVNTEGGKVKGFWVDGQRIRIIDDSTNDEIERFIDNTLELVKMDKFEVLLNGDFIRDIGSCENNLNNDIDPPVDESPESSFDVDNSDLKSFIAFEIIEEDYDFKKSLRGDDFSVKGFSITDSPLNLKKGAKVKGVPRVSTMTMSSKDCQKKREKGYYSSRSSRGLNLVIRQSQDSLSQATITSRKREDQDILDLNDNCNVNFMIKRNPAFCSFKENEDVTLSFSPVHNSGKK